METMTTALPITGDLLMSELWARDVRFIMGRKQNHPPRLDPEQLIAALAESHEARLGMALIPLFLQYPSNGLAGTRTPVTYKFPARFIFQRIGFVSH